MLGRLSSTERGSAGRLGLAERRKSRRHRILIASFILLLLLLAATVYGLWRSSVRISHVVMYGTDQSLAEIATEAMQGKYLGSIPRDSTFFVPEARIRADILAAHPDIAAVSIFRNGLTGLSIKVDYRVPVARWCGSTSSPQAASTSDTGRLNLSADCYFFDASGFVYATTSMAPQAGSVVNPFIVYEPEGSQTSLISPIGMTLPNAEKFPAVFDFARQLGAFGSPVTSVVFRGDEVDVYLSSGTRITYVLGDEQNAFTALASARSNFNLSDGSLDYIDLRFGGKMYLKKK